MIAIFPVIFRAQSRHNRKVTGITALLSLFPVYYTKNYSLLPWLLTRAQLYPTPRPYGL